MQVLLYLHHRLGEKKTVERNLVFAIVLLAQRNPVQIYSLSVLFTWAANSISSRVLNFIMDVTDGRNDALADGRRIYLGAAT